MTVPADDGVALLVLEDGRIFRGRSYGAVGETRGEAVFSTGMTGYQETLTDPSYRGQVVVMTTPHVGNTGMNDDDPESLLDLVLHARTSFQDSCLSFCDRAETCFRTALADGNGVVLGNDAERFLNGVTLHRLDQLMSGAAPTNPTESDLMARLASELPVLP